jgi:DNA-binding response OmpR family regulator
MMGAPGRVLVVEDDFLVCDTIIGVLEDLGFEGTRATDGAGAFKLLMTQKEHYVAVVIDLRLPGDMSGRTLARAIRDFGPGIVLISADHEEIAAAREDDHKAVCLTKPFSADELLHCIARTAKRLAPDEV